MSDMSGDLCPDSCWGRPVSMLSGWNTLGCWGESLKTISVMWKIYQ
jgi:hypothetical protein